MFTGDRGTGPGAGPGTEAYSPPQTRPGGSESRKLGDFDRPTGRDDQPGASTGRRRSSPSRAGRRGWSCRDDDPPGDAVSRGEAPSLAAAGPCWAGGLPGRSGSRGEPSWPGVCCCGRALRSRWVWPGAGEALLASSNLASSAALTCDHALGSRSRGALHRQRVSHFLPQFESWPYALFRTNRCGGTLR